MKRRIAIATIGLGLTLGVAPAADAAQFHPAKHAHHQVVDKDSQWGRLLQWLKDSQWG